MTDKEVLKIYVDLAPFLSEVLGPGCEVIVHDTRNHDHSIIAIENNLSGRELGGPITDLALDIIQDETYSDKNYLTNYKGTSHTGGTYSSSTYVIKNRGRIIGLLCINKSLTEVNDFENSLKLLMERYNLTPPENTEVSEDLNTSVNTLMNDRIAKIISESGVNPSRMSLQEKTDVVKKLSESGILMMKGAIPEIASQLGVSVPTVYRYLKKSADG